jgi:hypothetical protein
MSIFDGSWLFVRRGGHVSAPSLLTIFGLVFSSQLVAVDAFSPTSI